MIIFLTEPLGSVEPGLKILDKRIWSNQGPDNDYDIYSLSKFHGLENTNTKNSYVFYYFNFPRFDVTDPTPNEASGEREMSVKLEDQSCSSKLEIACGKKKYVYLGENSLPLYFLCIFPSHLILMSCFSFCVLNWAKGVIEAMKVILFASWLNLFYYPCH